VGTELPFWIPHIIAPLCIPTPVRLYLLSSGSLPRYDSAPQPAHMVRVWKTTCYIVLAVLLNDQMRGSLYPKRAKGTDEIYYPTMM
uniref:Uncharacterized protein n=1 Tax=Terrapene triunguis TaxID=2587831 RepID=A0A674HY72_9SAUR